MKQFKNILVVAPFEKPLLHQAMNLLTSNHSKLTLMSTIPNLEDPSVTTQDGKEVNLQQLLQNDVMTQVEQTADVLRKDGHRVKTVVKSGSHTFLEVIQQVKAKKHDLVMMLTDGVTSVREQLFGTLSMHLMRRCPCAVWVVKPSRRKKFRNVFAAVDPDQANETRDGLNSDILKRATSIAHASGAKLHVIHAWKALGGVVNRSRRWMSRQDIRLYVEKLRLSHRRQLDQLLKKHLDGSEVVHMIQGEPGAVIPEKISDMNGDMLVMGTVCRTGIPGFFIGNTAETILQQVDCSVLTVKPAGFESPI